jgi:putative Mg2+ transporter-C (MgtC) family protein
MSSWWEQLVQGLGEDFSDLPGTANVARAAVRLLTAAMLGGILGYQREHEGKSAGLRTHILVACGGALVVLASQQAGMTSADVSRIIQGVVTGIGFLGAGTIIKHKDAGHVRGLTTAAGIWFTAAVGMAAGLGRESLAFVATALALIVLVLLPHGTDHSPRHQG